MLNFAFTTQFRKDYTRMKKRVKNMDKINEIIALLVWNEPLPERC